MQTVPPNLGIKQPVHPPFPRPPPRTELSRAVKHLSVPNPVLGLPGTLNPLNPLLVPSSASVAILLTTLPRPRQASTPLSRPIETPAGLKFPIRPTNRTELTPVWLSRTGPALIVARTLCIPVSRDIGPESVAFR